MISKAVQRARWSTMATVISVGLVATLGVDIAQATSGGSSVHRAGAKSADTVAAEQAYLKALRPVALRVHDAVGPAQNVMLALLRPHAGDAYAARDALVHGGALAALHAARVDLQHLHAPAPLSKQQGKLVNAAEQMEHALRKAHSWTAISGHHLFNAVNNFDDGGLASGASSWQLALNDAYSAVHQQAPAGLAGGKAKTTASRTSWIFTADRSCSAATYKLGDLQSLLNEHSTSGIQTYNRHWETTLGWLGGKLKALPRPNGRDAVPAAVRTRLGTLRFNASLYKAMIAQINRHDLPAVERTLNQLDQVRATLRVLSTAMNRYGARSCGLIIGEWSGRKVAAAHSSSTVNT